MKDTITIKNDLGEEKTFDIVFSFISKDTNKEYITYTDYTKDYKGNIKSLSTRLNKKKRVKVRKHEKIRENRI